MTTLRLENFKNGDNWRAYVEQLNSFISLNDIPEEKQKPFLITQLSTPVYEILCNLCSPDSPQDKKFTYENLVKKLECYFHSDTEYKARFELTQKKQGQHEVKEYRIKEQLTEGVKSEALCFKVFKAAGSLKDLIKIATEVEWEQTETYTKETTENGNQKSGLYAVSQFRRTQTGTRNKIVSRQGRPRHPSHKQANDGTTAKVCYCCGKNDHFATKCLLRFKYCSECGKQGHISKTCKIQNDSHITIADSHHHSSITSTMLEPASRLQAGTGFTSALRDIPSFACSVQPNRSLPLRPAPPLPRRKPSVLCTTETHQKVHYHNITVEGEAEKSSTDKKDGQQQVNSSETLGNDETTNGSREEKDKNSFDQRDDVSEKSQLERQLHLDQQQEQHRQEQPKQQKEQEERAEASNPTDLPRNGERRLRSESPRPRIIEDIVVVEASGPEPQHTKMVPPLRLKKIAKQRTSSDSSEQPASEVPAPQEDDDRAALEEEGEDTSKYCIVTAAKEEASPIVNDDTMGGEMPSSSSDNVSAATASPACTANSIEIMIPSVPELGIKETRTDRISLPQQPTKPFIVNYILGKDAQYPTLMPVSVHVPVLAPVPVKNPEPEGPPQQYQQPQPQQQPQKQQQKSDQNEQQQQQQSVQQSPTNLSNHKQASSSPEGSPSSRSMPLLIAEEPDEVFILDASLGSPKSAEKRAEWVARRQHLREKFRELRAKVMDTRQRMCCALADEGSPQRGQLQEMIDSCDRQINHYSNLLRKLNEANSSPKFDSFCEEKQESFKFLEEEMKLQTRRSSAEELRRITNEAVSPEPTLESKDQRLSGDMRDRSLQLLAPTVAHEPQKSYGSVISETSSFEKSRITAVDMSPKITSPNIMEIASALNLKRKPPTSNGYSTIPHQLEACNSERRTSVEIYEGRAKSTDESVIAPTSSPRSYVVSTSQSAKSVIVEPMPRTSSEPVPASSSSSSKPTPPQRSYSSFLIDELSAAPMPSNPPPTSAVIRPSAYPLHSRESLGARAPPNSPREALIATSVPAAAWADHQHAHHGNNSTSITDLTAAAGPHHHHHHHQQQQQQQQMQRYQLLQQKGSDAQLPRDDRRPLDLAIKSTKRPSPQEEPQADKEEKRKRRRVSDISSHWAYSSAQQGFKSSPRAISVSSSSASSSSSREQHYLQQHYPAYVQESALWSPADMLPPGQRLQRNYTNEQHHHHQQQQQQRQQQVARSLDYHRALATQHEKHSIEYKQIVSSDYVLAVQRMHENAATPEQTKARESAHKSTLNQQRSIVHRMTPKSSHGDAAASKSMSQQQHEELAAKNSQEPRFMAEFPSLGDWVTGLVKKQASDAPSGAAGGSTMKKEGPIERSTPQNDTRQTYYQSSSTSLYKTTNDIGATASGNYAGSSMSGRWPTSEQQQQQQQQQQAATRSFQQVPLPAAPPLPPRHQSFYPPISPASIALSYPAKFPMDLYQKNPVLGYSTPYPYGSSIPYQRLSSSSLEAATLAAGQQRVPPLIPLTSNSSALLDPLSATADKRLQPIQLPPTATQRYYPTAETASPRIPSSISYASFGRRTSLVNLDYSTVSAEQQAQYARILASQAAVREMSYAEQQQRTTIQSQAIKVSTPELSRGLTKQFKSGIYAHSVPQVSRNGTVIGSAASTPTSIYTTSNPAPPPLHAVSRQQQHLHHQSSSIPMNQPPSKVLPQSQATTSYERDCPTPNLGEVNRSPSGIQSLRCSYCGAPGSRFECLGCETAFYCNEACQAHHWTTHGPQCPKIMPRLKKVA